MSFILNSLRIQIDLSVIVRVYVESIETGTWAKKYRLCMNRRKDFMKHYHKRFNIETAYSMIKGKFGSF
jgi:hypothetical protein